MAVKKVKRSKPPAKHKKAVKKKIAKKKPKFTPKQARFIDEYLVDLNATQAGIRAGYSKKTANEQGARLLAKVGIKAEIKKRMAEVAEATGITVKSVIESIVGTQGRARVAGKFSAELKAAELLGKHVGAFEKDNRQQGETFAEALHEAMKK